MSSLTISLNWLRKNTIKQEAWEKFIDKHLKDYSKLYPTDHGEDGIRDYLIDQAMIRTEIDKLKDDIILNFNLYKTIFTSNLSNMSLTQIIDIIREKF